MNTSDGMISVEDAQERILAHVHQLEPVALPLMEVLGQVLADDVTAAFDIPPLANSAMDGYAVRAEDILGSSIQTPVVLPIIGQVAAGYLADRELLPGTTIRIMTGAPIPSGADTVVPFEETDELERRRSSHSSSSLTEIGIMTALSKGSNVRPAGEDVRQGVKVLAAGTLLRAPHIGVLASLGLATAQVIRRPIVAILATGDELKEPGEPLQPGQIYNSNSYTLAALALTCGATPRILPVARDTVDDLTEKIASGLDADIFITSAGVSTGEYDLVKDVLTRQGSMDFWQVRMRPGKPLAFGLLRRTDGSLLPHLGLPGNPVSSMIAFDQFARPALFKMMGKLQVKRPVVTAVIEEAVTNPDRRRFYARAIVSKRDGRYYARLTGSQGSNVLTSMVVANSLLVITEDLAKVEPGASIQVEILEGHEDLLT